MYKIGGTRGFGNIFYWSDGSIVNTDFFCSGEPNNYLNNENCLLRVKNYACLNDAPCDLQFKSVCKYSIG